MRVIETFGGGALNTLFGERNAAARCLRRKHCLYDF